MSWFGPGDPMSDSDGLLPTARARKAHARAEQLKLELSPAECLYLTTFLFFWVGGQPADSEEDLDEVWSTIDMAGEQCQETFLNLGLSQAQMLFAMGGLALCFAAAAEEHERGEGPQRRPGRRP